MLFPLPVLDLNVLIHKINIWKFIFCFLYRYNQSHK